MPVARKYQTTTPGRFQTWRAQFLASDDMRAIRLVHMIGVIGTLIAIVKGF